MKKSLRYVLAVMIVGALLSICGCGEEPAVDDGAVHDSAALTGVTDEESAQNNSGSWYSLLTTEERAVADVILLSAEAMNARDADTYMTTVDPESKVYDSTLADAKWLFAHYRLLVMIDDLDVVSMDGDTAVVTVTQSTYPLSLEEVLVEVPVSGSDVTSTSDAASFSDAVRYIDPNPLSGSDKTGEFAPCVTVLTHTLTMRDGVWYISSTVIESRADVSSQSDDAQ